MPESVFSSLALDLLIIAGFGALGGFGLGLLQEKGLEIPRLFKSEGVRFTDLGFLAEVGVGAVAALVSYSVNPPVDIPKLVGLGLIAGVGGVGILRGYTKGTDLQEQRGKTALQEHKTEAAKEVATALAQDPTRMSASDVREAIERVS